MDLIFGILYGSFGYFMAKHRKGDCMSSMLSLAPSISGYFGVYDKPYSPSVKKFLYDVPMWILHLWASMKITAVCVGQYNFSVQNPWREVFASKGEMNPYVIGEEARKRKAEASNLNYHANYMQAQAAKDTYEEKKVKADDVWNAAAEDGELKDNATDSEVDDF